MANEATILLETRANLVMNWDMDAKKFRPMAEIVLVTYSPSYKIPVKGGRVVKELKTSTQRITLSLNSAADLIKSIEAVKAQLEQFGLLADAMSEMMVPRAAEPKDGLFQDPA
jgi:hypothetical protein